MKYLVKTIATIERLYEVEADDVKSAIAASTDASFVSEELIEEETMGVYLEGIAQEMKRDGQ